MKEVTIDNVRERIAELEMVHGHGELSLRGEFELACLRMLAASHEREKVRAMHAVWSQATFGDVGPIGPLKHLAKEAMEAAAEPGDLSEWADMQFLLWDAQRRADITDEQITQAMIDKLAVNKQREWPEPKDGEPRLHIKAQPAPVVPDGLIKAVEFYEQVKRENPPVETGAWKDAVDWVLKEASRAAMLNKAQEPATDNTAQQFEALASSGKSEHLLNAERIAREAKALSDRLNGTSAVHHRVSGWSERQQKVIAYSLWRFSCTAYQKANQAAQTNNKEMFDRFIRDARFAEEIREEFTSAWSGKP